MILDNIINFKNGWFLGDFSPSIFRTKDFEVGIISHRKGEQWATHYHKLSREINFVIEGSLEVQDKVIVAGEFFVLEPWEISNPIFLEDSKILCIKIPSCPGDKYEVSHTTTQ